MRIQHVMAVALFVVLSTPGVAVTRGGWVQFGGLPEGCNGPVAAIAAAADGSVYLGGQFDICGDVPVRNIVKWTGARFESLGTGLNNGVDGSVRAIAVSGSKIYVGGQFLKAGDVTANSVAAWNGTAWSALGTGVKLFDTPGEIAALLPTDGGVYVAGAFDSAGNISTQLVARWDGAWHALGGGVNCGFPCRGSGLGYLNNELYVAGSFALINGATVNNVARWTGNAWSSLAGGTNGSISALQVFNGSLVVGGSFTSAGGSPASKIAAWNGSTWASLGAGIPNFGEVGSFGVFNGSLFAGGDFSTIGTATGTGGIARWTGSDWVRITPNGVFFTTGNNVLSGFGVRALAGSQEALYLGGAFDAPGSVLGSHVVKWNGSAFQPMGPGTGNGINGPVRAVLVVGTDVYVAGQFTKAGIAQVQSVARWDGATWNPIGVGRFNGVDGGDAFALAMLDGQLHVGGDFTTAGGASKPRLVRWDGTTWKVVGGGLQRANGLYFGVYALQAEGKDLLVGGSFDMAGTVVVPAIARWNGSAWSGLGSGVSSGSGGAVFSIATAPGSVVVGGSFNTAGGVPANSVAKFGSGAWSSLGTGDQNGVAGGALAVETVGASVYVGGNFPKVGAEDVFGIASWNAVAGWQPLIQSGVTGVGAPVTALTAANDAVYVGGLFRQAGPIIANGVARWDGTWSPLGVGPANGVNGVVLAMERVSEVLVTVGDFGSAGGHASAGIAIFREPSPGFIFGNGLE